MRRAKLLIFVITLLILMIGASTYIRFGGGATNFPDRTSKAVQSWDDVELVANLSTPPGNIAVSDQGRVFISQHPEAHPDLKIVELKNGVVLAFPDLAAQAQWHTPLGIRIDQQQRLWVLDASNHGFKQVTLTAYNIESKQQIHHHTFEPEIMGLGSHANDLQVSADGKTIYIADASILSKKPAIIIYNTETQSARRILSAHNSVIGDKFTPVVHGNIMSVAGIFDIRPGVDSIALDRQGEWLYFAPITEDAMYRIATKDLLNEELNNESLALKIETFGKKTMSDGITIDHSGRLYLSDIENNAIVRMDQQGNLTTLLKHPNLRWPDGFSFGNDGWLYLTCSSLHEVIGRLPSNIEKKGPYQVYRFKPKSLKKENNLAGH